MNKPRKILFDCDPGHDDAMALMWALARPDELELVGVTTCAGNQTIQKTTRNALRMLTFFGRSDIPVAVGADRPLVHKLREEGAPIVHGQSGLDGPALPEPSFAPIDKPAYQFIIDTLEAAQDKITLVPTAPLTNIALAFSARPDLLDRIECISLMGGGTIGNWTPAAEFNIWWDAEAAKIVFNADVPILMSGLDATQKAYVTREENEVLRAQGNRASVLAAELIDFYSRYHYEVEGFPGCTLHDPCAMAVLLDPTLFVREQCNVDVEVKGELTYGMTVVDRINYLGKIMGEQAASNATVLFGVDRERFVSAFLADMKKLG